MKYLSSRFEEYIAENEKSDLHENMDEIFKKLKKSKNHLIFYGPD